MRVKGGRRKRQEPTLHRETGRGAVSRDELGGAGGAGRTKESEGESQGKKRISQISADRRNEERRRGEGAVEDEVHEVAGGGDGKERKASR